MLPFLMEQGIGGGSRREWKSQTRNPAGLGVSVEHLKTKEDPLQIREF